MRYDKLGFVVLRIQRTKSDCPLDWKMGKNSLLSANVSIKLFLFSYWEGGVLVS
jgi:hypothetical protein